MHLVSGEPETTPWTLSTLEEVVGRVLAAVGPVTGRPVVLAVDGRSSSGKTSLAERLAAVVPLSRVVHTDDIAWHHAAFAWTDAMVEGVLEPVRRGEPVAFRPPGWVAKGREGAVEVPAGLDLVVVEGDGASRRALGPWLDGAVVVQSDQGVVDARNAAREAAGEMSPAGFASWMAEENPFVLADRPWERADVVVTGTPDRALPGCVLGPDKVVVGWAPPGRSVHLLEATYAAVTTTVETLDDTGLAAPTATEWTVAELLLHLLLDAQRALVTLHSPDTGDPDVDAASYWAPFVPGSAPDAEAAHLRWVRAATAAYPAPKVLLDQWRATSQAAVAAARAAWYADPSARVTTQGHVLTVADFVSTLVVEATVHLLDLTAHVEGVAPARLALSHTRDVLEQILGGPLPAAWTDREAVLRATGRVALTPADREVLAADAARLPLLG